MASAQEGSILGRQGVVPTSGLSTRDVDDLVNSGTPSTGAGGLSGQEIASAPSGQFTGHFSGTGQDNTSAASQGHSSTGKQSEGAQGQNEAAQHIDTLASSIAGAALVAPMAALEKISPVVAEKVSAAASTVSSKVQSTTSSLQQNPTAQQYANQAQTTAANAGNQAVSALYGLKDALVQNLPVGAGGNPSGTGNVRSAPTVDQQSTTTGSSAFSNPTVQNIYNTVAGTAQQARDAIANTLGGTTSSSGSTSVTDTGRQSAGDKLESTLKPESQKSYTESAADSAKKTLDQGLSGLQPESEKSFGQKATDFTSSGNYSGSGLTDTGRQSAGDKLGSSLKPDSSKSYTESAADYTKGTVDQGLSYLQPEGNKSLGQKATDAFSNDSTGIFSGGDTKTSSSIYDDAANATQRARDALSNAGSGTTSSSSGLGSNNPFSATDSGRQSASDKISSSIKPESQKTYTEKAADYTKGTADKGLSYLQGDSNKSYGQKTTDTFQ